MAKKVSSKKILKNSTSGRKHLQDPKIVEPKNRRDLTKTTGPRPFMEQEVYFAIDCLRAGMDIETLTQLLCNKKNERTKRKYAPRFVENIITTANQLIQMWYRNQIYKVEKLHIMRYNAIIINELNKSFAHIEKEWVAKKMESMALENVLQAMKQKETLLGMHRKTFRLIFNSQMNVFLDEANGPKQAKDKKKSLNLELLSLEEKIELLHLIHKSSMTEDELSGVLLRVKEAEEDTIDVEAEIVQPANVERIEQFRKPDIVAEEKGSMLEDIQRKLIEKSLNR